MDEAPRSSAIPERIDALKGVRCGEGGVPLPNEERSGDGACQLGCTYSSISCTHRIFLQRDVSGGYTRALVCSQMMDSEQLFISQSIQLYHKKRFIL